MTWEEAIKETLTWGIFFIGVGLCIFTSYKVMKNTNFHCWKDGHSFQMMAEQSDNKTHETQIAHYFCTKCGAHTQINFITARKIAEIETKKEQRISQ